jgi:hypothetical protein
MLRMKKPVRKIATGFKHFVERCNFSDAALSHRVRDDQAPMAFTRCERREILREAVFL